MNNMELTDTFHNVTLLYADIAGFTAYSNKCQQEKNPLRIVDMLRYLYTDFDKECERLKCYKVYTIGDCYVAMGFIDSTKRDPVLEAHNVVEFGLNMVKVI